MAFLYLPLITIIYHVTIKQTSLSAQFDKKRGSMLAESCNKFPLYKETWVGLTEMVKNTSRYWQ